MRTTTLILASIAAIATIGSFYMMTATPTDPVIDSWVAWKKSQGKAYGTPTEENHFFNNFKSNFAKVHAHDAAAEGFTIGLNKFADLSIQEFKAVFTGLKTAAANTIAPSSDESVETATCTSSDWVKAGQVTPVRDQGQCGSCWAFSTVASVENRYVLKHNGNVKTTDFAEQELVDCSKGQNEGCNGGFMLAAFSWLQKSAQSGGMASEASYPYTAVDGSCKSKQATLVAGSTGFTGHKEYTTCDALESRLCVGPASIGVAADDSWQLYTSGVLKDASSCSGQIDHGVFVTGFDASAKTWSVKNSWGKSWGENGYVRVSRKNKSCTDARNGFNICTNGSYPTN